MKSTYIWVAKIQMQTFSGLHFNSWWTASHETVGLLHSAVDDLDVGDWARVTFGPPLEVVHAIGDGLVHCLDAVQVKEDHWNSDTEAASHDSVGPEAAVHNLRMNCHLCRKLKIIEFSVKYMIQQRGTNTWKLTDFCSGILVKLLI